MAKLRKMLGDPTGPRAKALMALIDTQSASTLGRWAAAYAEERYLPILSRRPCHQHGLRCDSDADECPWLRLLWRGGRGVRPGRAIRRLG